MVETNSLDLYPRSRCPIEKRMKQSDKIKEIEELANELALFRLKGKKIVHCHGVFDILHLGHIKHFQTAKSYGDILIVSVTSDEFINKGLKRPFFNEKQRAEMLSNLSCIDYVCVNNDFTPINLIKKIKPSYYVKGNDYKDLSDDITKNIVKEKKAIEEVNGELKYTNEIQFSSSSILNGKIFSSDTCNYLKDFSSRFSAKKIIKYFDNLKKYRVLVIGEAIIDEYYYGHSLGKSGKHPIVAFKLENLEHYLGGSLAIANHLSEFVNVDLITAINKSNIQLITQKISSNINTYFFNSLNNPTIIKRRYIENNQKIFETYTTNYNRIDKKSENLIIENLRNNIKSYDIVLITDFGHGLLTRKIREFLKENSKYLVLNAQINAGNMGYNTIRKYWDRKDNIFLSLDKNELQAAISDKYDYPYDINQILHNEFSNTDKIAITKGSEGCVYYSKNSSIEEIPAFTNQIEDTVGAGDAFLALSSLCILNEKAIPWLGFVGNVAGALAVSYSGNEKHITKKELFGFIETLLK